MKNMFVIEVLVRKPGGGQVWEKVRPSGGEPYRYSDEDEAIRMARMCYPDAIIAGGVRVRNEQKTNENEPDVEAGFRAPTS